MLIDEVSVICGVFDLHFFWLVVPSITKLILIDVIFLVQEIQVNHGELLVKAIGI